MSDRYVSDTMAIVLRLEKRKLKRKVKTIFENVEKGKTILLIPAMVLAEIGYLSEKSKIDTNLKEVENYCRKYPAVQIQPITDEIIYKSFEIDDIPELHDRIIAGTAYHKNLELTSSDSIIQESKFVSTIRK